MEQLRLQVGPGEAEALVVVQEQEALLIVDDRRARRPAQQRGVQFIFIGTAAVVAEAAIPGRISVDEVEPILRELARRGMYLGEEVIQQMLRRVREHAASGHHHHLPTQGR